MILNELPVKSRANIDIKSPHDLDQNPYLKRIYIKVGVCKISVKKFLLS